MQYRFGLPGKIELEYPKDRQGTQQKFHYRHYFRAQFDMTEIGFTIDGYEYSVFDDYNGEGKPVVISRGVTVTAPGKPKEVSFVCRVKPKADYSDLQTVLPPHSVVGKMLQKTLEVQYAGEKAAADRFIDQYTTWKDDLHGIVAKNIRDQSRYRFRVFKYAALGE